MTEEKSNAAMLGIKHDNEQARGDCDINNRTDK